MPVRIDHNLIQRVAELINLLQSGTISNRAAKDALPAVAQGESSPRKAVNRLLKKMLDD